MNLEIDHIGYLVKKIDKAIQKFEKLGYKLKGNITRDTIRHIDICFMSKDGYVIELVSPYDDESVVAKLIKRLGNSPYHICYKTNNFSETIQNLTKNGFTMIDKPLEALAFGNKKVVFMINHLVGMIELLDAQ